MLSYPISEDYEWQVAEARDHGLNWRNVCGAILDSERIKDPVVLKEGGTGMTSPMLKSCFCLPPQLSKHLDIHSAPIMSIETNCERIPSVRLGLSHQCR